MVTRIGPIKRRSVWGRACKRRGGRSLQRAERRILASNALSFASFIFFSLLLFPPIFSRQFSFLVFAAQHECEKKGVKNKRDTKL